MIGIDLFSGAGGMSLGAEMSGIKVSCAVEANCKAAETYARNHPGVAVLAKRIEQITRKDLPKIPRREPLIIFGGPPCRGFSTANQQTRSSRNPDNWLFKEYIRVVSELVPEWVVFENVTGILQTERGHFVDAVANELHHLGYSTSLWVLNAADFGVPQRRSRLFIIATFGVNVTKPRSSRLHTNVRDAIWDLPYLKNGASVNWLPYRCDATSEYAKKMRGKLNRSSNHLVTSNHPSILRRYSYVPQGGNWEDIPKYLMRNYTDRERCHEWIYHRLRAKEPSVVIGNYRKNMLIHPTQNRGLSVREAARLQSFPDWFEFTGSIGFQQQQVGNAVPPLLARAVFDSVQCAAGEIPSKRVFNEAEG